MKRASLGLIVFCAGTCAVLPQTGAKREIPDWALPGSAVHKQVPPPKDFHRAARTDIAPLGIFQGQSDIGGALVPGSSSYDQASGQYTLASAGYNIWYSRDEFRYAWRKMSGDAWLAADVGFPDPHGYDDRKAVLVIRQTLDDDAKEAVVGEHGTGMIHLALRPEAGAEMTDAQFRFGGALADAKAKRIGIEKRGDQIALFVSIRGEPMHQFGPPVTLPLQGPFYVGIGFCSHQPVSVDSARFTDVSLAETGP